MDIYKREKYSPIKKIDVFSLEKNQYRKIIIFYRILFGIQITILLVYYIYAFTI